MAETAYFTQQITIGHVERGIAGGISLPSQMWVVCQAGNPGHALAYCPSLDDAERLKALLVYYGDRFPPHDDVPARMTP